MRGGQLKFLTKDQIKQIYLGTLEILEQVGVVFNEKNALKIFQDAGADVDQKTRLVKFPPYLIEEAIRKTPRRFTVYARNSKYNVAMEDEVVWFEPMIGRKDVVDLNTGEKRPTNIEDARNLMKLVDSLDNYVILHSPAMMPYIEGVPQHASHAFGYFAGVTNSSKIVKGSGRGTKVAKDCLRMAAVIAGGEEVLRKKPMLFTTSNPISPLQHHTDQIEGLIEYAKMNQPVDITAEPQAGSTSPVTIAGTLVQMEAEVLSGVTLAQLVNPGAPVWMGTCGASMDMRGGMIALGSIEAGLINVAHAQISQFLGIPCRGTGSTTESKILDMQAGYEKAMTLMMPALAGSNMIFYPGTIEYAKTISYESLLIDHEICGIVYHALRGIPVDEEHLALDVIKDVGPQGHYLRQKHTIDYLQTEHFLPKISNRDLRETWMEKGSKPIHKVANERVKKILKTHQPEPLDRDIQQELEKILEEVKKGK